MTRPVTACACRVPVEEARSRRAFLRAGLKIAAGSTLLSPFSPLQRSAYALPVNVRVTRGIVTDAANSDPAKEADVIMTAVALGFSAEHIRAKDGGIRFDIEASDAEAGMFANTVKRMNTAVGTYLAGLGIVRQSEIGTGTTMTFSPGTVIMGVYKLTGQLAPACLPLPTLSPAGQKLWEKIYSGNVPNLYVGRGAYAGFVDVSPGRTDARPVGPLSTVRMSVGAGNDPGAPRPSPRWLPATDSLLWRKRKPANGSPVPWGLIMPDKPEDAAALTAKMQAQGMKFLPPQIDPTDIATYTHGMIQAIYRAYQMGPDCTPYEIPVGTDTKKLASCLPCTLFMYAAGYPPSSIHLGRGESWAPLYRPYDPDGLPPMRGEDVTVRALNARWYEKCDSWLRTGLDILSDRFVNPEYVTTCQSVRVYLASRPAPQNPTVAANLILDAVTIHDKEIARINRTLKAV